MELAKRNIDVNEKILHKEYSIWSILNSKRNVIIEDMDILQGIEEILKLT